MPPFAVKLVGKLPFVIIYGLTFLYYSPSSQAQVMLDLHQIKHAATGARSLLFKVNCDIVNASGGNLETTELEFEPAAEARLLSPSLLKIEAGNDSIRSRRFKFLLNKSEIHKDSILIYATLRSFGAEIVLAKDSVWLQTRKALPVVFKTIQNEVLIDKKSGFLPISLSNPNNFEIKTNLELYVPPPYLRGVRKIPDIALAPLKDTVILFPVALVGRKNIPSETPIFLKITDSRTDGFRLAHFKIYKINSQKRFIPTGEKHNFFGTVGANFTSASFGNYTRFEYSGAGVLHDRTVDIRFRPVYYSGQGQLQLYNSYFRTETEKYRLQIGNFQYQDELLLNGKSAFYEKKYDDISLGIGIINSNPNLLSFFYPNGNGSKSALRFNTVNKLTDTWTSRLVLIGQTGENTNTGLGQIELSRNRKHESLTFGLSAGTDINRPNGHRSGLSGKINYSLQTGNWKFTSKNYLAGNNHPGIFGGQVRLREKITYSGFSKWKVALAGNLNKYSARGLRTPNLSVAKLTDWNRFELQISKSLRKGIQFWFMPHIFQQKLIKQTTPSSFNRYSSISQRFKFGMRKNSGDFTFDFDFDPGHYQSSFENRGVSQGFSFRSNARIKYKNTAVNFFANTGKYYLFEEVEQLSSGAFLSAMLRQRWQFLHGKLRVSWSGQWVYDQRRKRNNQSMRLRVSGNIHEKWRWNTEVNILKSGFYTNTVFNIGIQKSFAHYVNFPNNKKLKLSIYFDENRNGKRDKSEEKIQGLFIKIGKESLLTDKSGEVKLTGLPEGEYFIKITDPIGRFAPFSTSVLLKKDKSLSVGLTQPFVISGKINLIREKFSDDRISPSGIKIKLLNPDGKHFETYTDAAGFYTFTVPRGSYYVQIDGAFSDRRFKIEDNFQKVIFSEEDPIREINFNVTIRSRKTKIKYFNRRRR